MKSFSKLFVINAEAEDVYAALTNPVTIAIWSGYPAIMKAEPGEEFSLWEGDITGRILEAVTNKKIVQEWYFGDQEEASVATIILKRDNGNTSVTVDHTNIPDDDFANISEGWREYIMGAIQKFLNPNF
jgi:activator of HSP90 ATPase